MNIKRLVILLLFCLALPFQNVLSATIEQQREVFLQAEKLVKKGNDSAIREKQAVLRDYPLYPYLQYQWLKRNLQNDREIRVFLNEHNETRYSGLLRNQWLDNLAKRGQWKTFIRNYQDNGKTALQCQYLWARYQTGYRKEALIEAKELWAVGKSQPKECDLLFTRLVKSEHFTEQLIWKRFDLSLRQGNVNLAEYLKRKLSSNDRKAADFWLRVHKNPALIEQRSNRQKPYKQMGLIFAHGADRLASSDPETSIKIWDRYKNDFYIDQNRTQQLERRLALALAFRKSNSAYGRLSRLPGEDKTVREWQIRAALLEGNWHHVETSLELLTEEEKRKPKWRYWQARALMATGRKEQAQLVFNQLAKDRSFYGFLAADHTGQNYHFADQPIRLEQGSLETLVQQPDFKVVEEFRNVNHDLEARRQWWYAIGKLDKEQIITAAKLAQQWGWTQIAIFTIARAEHWDDLKLRFPVDYSMQIKKNAAKRDLDAAIVFGLIRQESVFDKNVRSPAGARGLMQIMPRTGQQIAKDLKERWRSKNILFDPDVNVKYGTFYYKKLLDRFDGHFALATAAYNAGPSRVVRWLPEKGAVPADIWIETIPYKETRKYVATVLANAMIYQQLIGRGSLKMSDFMKDVYPY